MLIIPRARTLVILSIIDPIALTEIIENRNIRANEMIGIKAFFSFLAKSEEILDIISVNNSSKYTEKFKAK